jgi:hypothetical protein
MREASGMGIVAFSFISPGLLGVLEGKTQAQISVRELA